MGSGLNDRVWALAVSGSNVYAAARGSLTNYISRWDGSHWSTLGLGANSNVNVLVLAVSGGKVYAGGQFTAVANGDGVAVAATNIAVWDGSSWSALGSGVNGYYVQALAVSGSNVYAGGFFSQAGGVAANNIAKWNGSSWSALDGGTGSPVAALAVSGNELYAGGDFLAAGSVTAKNIAKWDGSRWSALGSGVNAQVVGLAVSGGDLYAAGNFTLAGRKAAGYVAKAILNPGSWQTLLYGAPGPQTNTLTFEAIPTNQYVIQFATNLTDSPWFGLATTSTDTYGYGTVFDPSATNGQRFYRLVAP
jgi:hypothetical protein